MLVQLQFDCGQLLGLKLGLAYLSPTLSYPGTLNFMGCYTSRTRCEYSYEIDCVSLFANHLFVH